MSRTDRFELRLTAKEREAFEWAAQVEGSGNVASWLRQLANQRVRKLEREVAESNESPEPGEVSR